MRLIDSRILGCFVAAIALLPAALWAAEPQHYNVVELQSGAEREVSNDLMQAVLYIEQNDANPQQVANTLNRATNEALRVAKDYPAVKVRSGNNQTTPVYTRANQLQGWRGRAEIRLETRDFAAGAALIAKLQTSLQLGGVSFAVAAETRKKAEDELIGEAMAAFRSRAELVKGVMGGRAYKIQHISLNTGYSGPPRPMLAAMAKSADTVTAPVLEGGTSVVSVQVAGSIEVE